MRFKHVVNSNSNSNSAMKAITLLTIAALSGVSLFALEVALGSHAIGTFGLATAALLLVGFVRDYSPRHRRREPRASVTPSPTARASCRAADRIAA